MRQLKVIYEQKKEETLNFTPFRVFLALSVHVLTATGVILAFLSMLAVMAGEGGTALRLLALAAFIDAFDGTFARRADVLKYTPYIDGALLDNLVDYLTWVFIPLIWAWVFLSVPVWVCVLCLFSSLFGFSHTEAKTPDHFFRGFPSYWNILIFYLFIFQAGPQAASIIMLVCAVLVLLPFKVIYPSRTPQFYKTTLAFSGIYICMLGGMLYFLTNSPLWLPIASFFFPLYYVVLSFVLAKKWYHGI